MDTGSFNSSDGDINAVMDESHNVSIVKNGSKFLFIIRTQHRAQNDSLSQVTEQVQFYRTYFTVHFQ